MLLEDNLLKKIPEDLDCLVKLKVLTLTGNPMEDPPMKVCAEGNEAIWEYLKEKKAMKRMAVKVKLAPVLDTLTVPLEGL